MSNETGDGSGDGVLRRARRLVRRRGESSDAALNGSDPAHASRSPRPAPSSPGSPSSPGPSTDPTASAGGTATGDSGGSGSDGSSGTEGPRSRPTAERPPDNEAEYGVDGNAAAYTGATYGLLLLLGFVVGIYGAFFFSLSVWVIPVGAVAGVLVNYAMCRVSGRVMRSRLGALLPAAGWLVAVILLSSHRSEGDLIITGTVGGYLLLFGGTAAAAVAVTMNQRERNRAEARTERPR